MYQRFSILLEKGQITAPTKPWGGGGEVSTHSFMKPIYNCRFFEVFEVFQDIINTVVCFGLRGLGFRVYIVE
jgi:hypothetical protein